MIRAPRILFEKLTFLLLVNIMWAPALGAQMNSCGKDCQELWFRDRFRNWEQLPAEVFSELLLKVASQSTDRERTLFLLDQVSQLGAAVPEPFAVQSLLLFTDSIPGVARNLLYRYPSRMTLDLDRLRIVSRIDVDQAAEQFILLKLPESRRPMIHQDEVPLTESYFEFGFELAETLRSSGKPLTANMVTAHFVQTIQTFDQLGDLSAVLIRKMQQNRLSEGFLSLYFKRAETLQFQELPQFQHWYPLLTFWRALLLGEMKDQKALVMTHIEKLTGKIPSLTATQAGTLFKTRRGDLAQPPFWPVEAQKYWKQIISSVQMEEPLAKRRSEFERALFVSGPNWVLAKQTVRTLLWARPESKKMFERRRELNLSREKLQPSGSWEADLIGLLDTVRDFNPKPESDEDRLLTFLERHYIWESLLKFSEPITKEQFATGDLTSIAKGGASRAPHASKERILRDIMSSLQGEEGTWVYNQRRLWWISTLKRYCEEINANQKDLIPFLQSLGSASASDVIRYYSSYQ